jgi:hypothetical protein
MKIPEQKERFPCRHCAVGGYHYPIHNGKIDKSERPSHRSTFKLLECENCGWLTLIVDNWVFPQSGGDSFITDTLRYPPNIVRPKPDWFSSLSEEYRTLLNEIYSALDNRLYTLASAGIRTAIDRLIVEMIGDIGTFKSKLSSLQKKGIVNNDEFDLMDSIIDAGSASVHRGYSPTQDIVIAMLEITEHIFFELKIRELRSNRLAGLAKEIKNEIPKRS